VPTCSCSGRVRRARSAARSWGASPRPCPAPRRPRCSSFPSREPVATKQSDWRRCGTPPPLPEETVHVWYAGLDVDEATFARLEAVTSVDERDRARRVRVASAGRRFLVARGILRTLLGAYLDAPPAALQLPAGGSEKPRLLEPEEPELRFNVSHSGDTALLAFARRLEVGVDIECEVEGRAPERP